jgi:hypothetical protein
MARPVSFADASGTDWWDDARIRALARTGLPIPAAIAEVTRNPRHYLRHVLGPNWLPPRGNRVMPSLWQIAEYWYIRDDVFDVDLRNPHCFGCGDRAGSQAATLRIRWQDAACKLDRAHLVARVYDGLDGPQNIVPLCGPCHRFQPDDDGARAVAWIQRGGWKQLVSAGT